MKLLDHLTMLGNFRNDAQMAEALEISAPVISRIRNGKCNVSAEIMIKIHEKYNMPIAEIKALCLSDQQSS